MDRIARPSVLRSSTTGLALGLFVVLPTAGCADYTPVSTGLAARVAAAHGGASDWQDVGQIRSEFTLERGGEVALKGTLTWAPHDNLVRFEAADGSATWVFDGERAWASRAWSGSLGPRFHLLTWTYFLGAAFKLDDPGALLHEQEPRELRGELGPSGRMTFAPGVGDAPDDWYVVYLDQKTDRLRGLAYIVTYGKADVREANEKPHAAYYESYTSVAGVRLPDHMTIWDWSEEAGLVGDAPLYVVRWADLKNSPVDRALYVKPDGAVEDVIPN